MPQGEQPLTVLSAFQQGFLSTSPWVTQFEVKSCFIPSKNVQAGLYIEKGLYSCWTMLLSQSLT